MNFCGNSVMAIIVKLARPPLDLGEALTRNKTTTWSGLIVALLLSVVKSSVILSKVLSCIPGRYVVHNNYNENFTRTVFNNTTGDQEIPV